VWIVGGSVLALVLILVGYHYGITLWDWLKLLVVPAVIAGGGLWFNRQQRERELEIAREQREQDAKIAESRTQDEALQAYLDQMSNLLIPNRDQPSLYDEDPPDSLKSVARARTLTVLPRLDGNRKARVVQFLYESGLISSESPVLALSGADLSDANLSEANLKDADLSGANLSKANLYVASLWGANLQNARLSNANLWAASLGEANLRQANLRGIDASHAILNDADLRSAGLIEAKLIEAKLLRAQLHDAYLHKANLSDADLGSAHLENVDLSEANLRRTNLRWTVLTWANLRSAEGITDEELAAQATSLEGATMPNGQKYEDWLKAKGRAEVG
jgi:uncharacterized protein YjbI with pentapeptide repeats